MAQVFNGHRTFDPSSVQVLDITADGAVANVTYTFADKPEILILGAYNKATGAALAAAYVKATGVLTVTCAVSVNAIVAVHVFA